MAATTLLDAILKANDHRVRGDASATADLPPGGVPLVISCQDPRLAGTLLQAMGLDNAGTPQCKIPGAVVRPGDRTPVRSLLVAAIVNGATEVLIVGHTDCRMGKLSSMDVRNGLTRLGIRPESFEGQDPAVWLGLFSSESQSVRASVEALRADHRVPPAMPIHGLLYNITARRLEALVRGYEGARTGAAGAGVGAVGAYRPGPASLEAPPPPNFGHTGYAPPPPAAVGPVSFGTPGSLSTGPVSFGSSSPMAPGAPPPIAPPGSMQAPSFPVPPPMAAPSPPPAPPQPAPPPAPDFPRVYPDKARKKPKANSPFDKASEMLDRMRRDRER